LLLFRIPVAGKKAATPVAETSAITAADENFIVQVVCRESRLGYDSRRNGRI
jgi:hypothetical protein